MKEKLAAPMKVPAGIFGIYLWSDAKAYLQAAKILIGEKSSDVIPPKYFLLSHALELCLKAYLVVHGVGDGDLRALGHDIKAAHQKAATLGLHLSKDEAVMIGLLSDFHRALLFRYPVIQKDDGSVTERGRLVLAADALALIQGVFKKIEGSVMTARMRAAGEGGEFLVETWHMGDDGG
jgi:hypothetical protein